MQTRRFLQGVFWTWASLIAISICTELVDGFYFTKALHTESTREYDDCMLYDVYLRFPIRCARVLANPPGSFYTSWISHAIGRVKWCGSSHCEDLLTWKGVLLSGAVLLRATGGQAIQRARAVAGRAIRAVERRRAAVQHVPMAIELPQKCT